MNRPITRREALWLFAGSSAGLRLGSAVAGSSSTSAEPPKRPPNIVVFMTDD